jgi:hypothetical protein
MKQLSRTQGIEILQKIYAQQWEVISPPTLLFQEILSTATFEDIKKNHHDITLFNCEISPPIPNCVPKLPLY